MSDKKISSHEFLEAVKEVSSVFTAHGFRRTTEFEANTPTTATVVFVGNNVAFTFTFDIRDQAVDLTVVRLKNGKLLTTWDGGYSASLFAHLVKHCGLRSRPTATTLQIINGSQVQRMVAANMSLLMHAGAAKLLADEVDSIP